MLDRQGKPEAEQRAPYARAVKHQRKRCEVQVAADHARAQPPRRPWLRERRMPDQPGPLRIVVRDEHQRPLGRSVSRVYPRDDVRAFAARQQPAKPRPPARRIAL